ncbi:hypothetical protein WR25_20230 [Diploscapter pachys]|uniref:Uncharacterized protein n=1 Tax=Diploscapter pachys TaxID=2018661 RepID=A0A2A2KBN9_9BILA|nr:hypothetical protein WR25_20230 [Diploscapter pachys]
MKRLLDALVGKDSSQATRESFKQRFADGHLDQTEIEIELEQAPSMPFEVPGGAPQMINLTEMMKSFGGGQQLKRRKLTVRAAWDKLNIGARRLQTVMEKLLEEVSFDAEDRSEPVTVDAAYVEKQLAGIARNTDLSRFVL